MLDYKKLSDEFTKVLNSISDKEFYEWIEMDRKRMALIEEEERIASQTAIPRRVTAKLNGAPLLTVDELNLEHTPA